ncbi:MAG: hypothetical protein SVN78_01405 [Deferribacterota bacterium]|nr:hypothetical protein [Deferribacterota bacterium]
MNASLISKLTTFLQNYTTNTKDALLLKIIESLGDSEYLIETAGSKVKARIDGDVKVGDIIRAKVLKNYPRLHLVKLNNYSLNSVKKYSLNESTSINIERQLLKSFNAEEIKTLIDNKKNELFNKISKLINGSDSDNSFINNIIKNSGVSTKELYQLLYYKTFSIYFSSPENNIEDAFIMIKKKKNKVFKCKLFLYMSNLGRVLIDITLINENFYILVRSDSDIDKELKDIKIDRGFIRWKKIHSEEFDKFSYLNYYNIKI